MNRTATGLVVALTITLIGGFVGLSLAGIDTTAYVLFCAGPAVSTAVGVVLSHKVGGVAEVVAQVKHQTNGIATAQNAAVQAHLTAQDLTAAEVATAATELAQNSPQPVLRSPESDRPAGP